MFKAGDYKLKVMQKILDPILMCLVSVVAFCYVMEGGVILPTLKKYCQIVFMCASKIGKVVALLVVELLH